MYLLSFVRAIGLMHVRRHVSSAGRDRAKQSCGGGQTKDEFESHDRRCRRVSVSLEVQGIEGQEPCTTEPGEHVILCGGDDDMFEC